MLKEKNNEIEELEPKTINNDISDLKFHNKSNNPESFSQIQR